MSQHHNHLGQPVGFPLTDWSPCPYPSRTSMEGRYCKLESLMPERHAQELYDAYAKDTEGRNWTYLPYGPFDSYAAYLAWMQETCMDDDPLFYAILDGKTGHAVGVASYLRITPSVGVIEVGHINFSPKMQRTPIATEAMYLMMSRIFDELGYRRYEWKCDALNAPSRQAAQRLGFLPESIFRQATMYKGRNRDTAWLSILDSEWPFLKDAFERWLAPSNFDVQGQQHTRLSELMATAREQICS